MPNTWRRSGAVIGREFDHQLLAAVSPVAGRSSRRRSSGLVGSELVFRRGEPPEASYIFKHALVQDAAYESMLEESSPCDLHAVHRSGARKAELPLQSSSHPTRVARPHHFQRGGGLAEPCGRVLGEGRAKRELSTAPLTSRRSRTIANWAPAIARWFLSHAGFGAAGAYASRSALGARFSSPRAIRPQLTRRWPFERARELLYRSSD